MPAISRFFVIFRHFSSFFVPFLFFLVDLDVLDFSFQFARLDVDAFDSVARLRKLFAWALADFWVELGASLARAGSAPPAGYGACFCDAWRVGSLWLVLHVGSSVAQVLVFCFWRANGPVMGRDFARMAGRFLWLVLHVGSSVA